jgi:regulator of RNase E activity RraA
MKIQYLLGGITPGHGEMAVHAVNVPVSVAGMDVAPGEIVHMDENGACKFPADKLPKVLENLRALREEESQRIAKLSRATTAAELRAILGGHSYAPPKKG